MKRKLSQLDEGQEDGQARECHVQTARVAEISRGEL